MPIKIRKTQRSSANYGLTIGIGKGSSKSWYVCMLIASSARHRFEREKEKVTREIFSGQSVENVRKRRRQKIT
jgi:hypothetical protein